MIKKATKVKAAFMAAAVVAGGGAYGALNTGIGRGILKDTHIIQTASKKTASKTSTSTVTSKTSATPTYSVDNRTGVCIMTEHNNVVISGSTVALPSSSSVPCTKAIIGLVPANQQTKYLLTWGVPKA